MEISDRMQLIINNGANYRSIKSSPFFRLDELGVKAELLSMIKDKVELKQNFQIEVEDLSEIVIVLKNKIGNY